MKGFGDQRRVDFMEKGVWVMKSVDDEASDNTFFGKGSYKFWALSTVLLLAFWSMFTGTITVTLRWSTGRLNHLSKEINTPIWDDLDVLEMKERDKVVKYIWDVYTNCRRINLPRFCQEAFEAAYEDMTIDVLGVREAGVTEIAKMSIRSIGIDLPPIHLACPSQPNNTDCGYYVLRYILDIIRIKQDSTLGECYPEPIGSKPLSKDKIDEVRDQWITFVHRFIF